MAKTVKRTKLSPYASGLFEKKTAKKHVGSVFKTANLLNALASVNTSVLNKKRASRSIRVTEVQKRNMPSRGTKTAFTETLKKAHNNKVKAAENRKKAAENRKKLKENVNNITAAFGKLNTKMNTSH
jgi:hypothetical protein